MEQNLKTQGFYLVDVDVVALNNAGKSVLSNFENGVAGIGRASGVITQIQQIGVTDGVVHQMLVLGVVPVRVLALVEQGVVIQPV